MRLATLLALAWRESRFARRRLFLFLSAITLGVAALVAVEGFATNLERGVRDEAKALLGGDVELGSRQPFGPRTEALLDSLTAAGVPVARVTSFASMALLPRTGGVRLARVQAVEPGFPFYGVIQTRPAGAWESFGRGRDALADPTLLVALRARVGDSLSLGEARFRIAGVLEKVPGDVEVASAFAPRLFIPARHLAATRLLDFGSRVEYAAYLRLPQTAVAERLLEGHRRTFRAERVRTETAAEQMEDVSRALGRLSSYLGLVGVFALLLGGIGVASAMGAYIAQKVDTVAVLRCLGATGRQVLAIYVMQAAAMGLGGALLGAALGVGVQWVLPQLVRGLIPVEVRVEPDVPGVLTGIGVGVWTAVVFALLPLLRVRRVSPLGALRRRVEALRLPGRDYLSWTVWGALAASVLLLVTLQVESLRLGAWLTAGVGGALALLWLAAWGLMRGVRRLRRGAGGYTLRQGLANLHRPGNQTRTVVVALGFGVCLLATLLLVQHNLLRPLRSEEATARANLVLWDVQEDQEPGVHALLRRRGRPVLQRAPLVPMRVAGINGEEVRPWRDDESAEEADGAEDGGREGEDGEARRSPEGWALRREYRSTYRDSLVHSERLVRGRWWTPGTATAEPFPISLEEDIAGDLGVDLGDRIEWDVQGVRVHTEVTSIRAVDWARFEPNFFAVFPTAALRGAPQSWVMLTRAEGPAERALLQRELVERYPNVAALDLTQVQQTLDEVIDRIALVIRFLAGFSVATGFVVLLGAVSTGRLQRVRESVLLKTIGATRRQIGAILFVEYLAFGLLAALAGSALAVVGGWALARWVFDVPFEVTPLPLTALGGGVAALAVTVGVWASREVFQRTPLEAIREE